MAGRVQRTLASVLRGGRGAVTYVGNEQTLRPKESDSSVAAMTWQRALGIVLAVAIYNLWRVYRVKRQAKLDARTDIPVYRNWRGEYVPDLHLIRLRRAVIWAWVLFFVAGFPLGYVLLTNYPIGAAAAP